MSSIIGRKFTFSHTVNFDEVDMGGGLYHPNYLVFLDRARGAMMQELGYPFKAMLAQGFAFVLAENYSKYLAPAFLDDQLDIRSEIVAMTNNSMRIKHQIYKKTNAEPKFIHAMQVRLVCVNLTRMAPAEFPPRVIEILGYDAAALTPEQTEVKVKIET